MSKPKSQLFLNYIVLLFKTYIITFRYGIKYETTRLSSYARKIAFNVHMMTSHSLLGNLNLKVLVRIITIYNSFIQRNPDPQT